MLKPSESRISLALDLSAHNSDEMKDKQALAIIHFINYTPKLLMQMIMLIIYNEKYWIINTWLQKSEQAYI